MPRRDVHVSARPRLGRAEPARDARRLRARGGAAAVVVNLVVSRFRGAPAGQRPVRRRDARVGHDLSPARLQLHGHPDGLEPVPDVGRARPRGGRARASSAASWCSTHGHETPATTVLDAELGRGARHAVGLAVADRARRRRSALVFVVPADRPLDRPRSSSPALRGRRSPPGIAGAAGGMTSTRGDHRAGGAALPNGWWGMALVPRHRGDAVRHADRVLLLPALHVADGRRAASSRPSVALPAGAHRRARADRRADAARVAAAARGRARAAWLLVALALAVQGGYLAVQIVSYLARPHTFRPDGRTPTGRSTSRCSAPTTRTCSSACCSNPGCSARLLGGLTALPGRSRVRAVALYWYVVAAIGVAVVADPGVAVVSALARRLLVWFGLFAAPAAWAAPARRRASS